MKLTLEEIKALDKAILTPTEIAGVLQCDPYKINLMARERPERLGFPVTMIGTSVKIPRIPFIKFIEGDA